VVWETPTELGDAGGGESAWTVERMLEAGGSHGVVVFGYGSLVWRPGFPHDAAVPAVLPGYVRRFWQASPDHRGTPSALGRVATLVPAPAHSAAGGGGLLLLPGEEASTAGVAFRLSPDGIVDTLTALFFREKAGYTLLHTDVTVTLPSGGTASWPAFIFTADATNPYWCGPPAGGGGAGGGGEAPGVTAAIIARAAGPSGTNREYFDNLLAALRERGVRDVYMEALAAAVATASASDVAAPGPG